MTNKSYSVWVGGTEINDHYLTREEAADLAQEYIDQDYDDVRIEYFPHINGGITL